MKANLKLTVGSFFFLGNVSLVRGLPTEVDFSKLTNKELKTLKDYIASGHIESDASLDTITAPNALSPSGEPIVPVEIVEPVFEDPALQPTESRTYAEMTARELKELLDARGIETRLTSKKDLIALLEEDDKED